MESPFDQTADETIELLEARLRRIEYVVTGQRAEVEDKDDTRPAIKRLEGLERSLNRLVGKSRLMQDLLKIRKSPHWFPFKQRTNNYMQMPVSLSFSTIRIQRSRQHLIRLRSFLLFWQLLAHSPKPLRA